MPLRGATVRRACSIGAAIVCGADIGRLISSAHVRGVGKVHFTLGPYIIAVGLSVLAIGVSNEASNADGSSQTSE